MKAASDNATKAIETLFAGLQQSARRRSPRKFPRSSAKSCRGLTHPHVSAAAGQQQIRESDGNQHEPGQSCSDHRRRGRRQFPRDQVPKVYDALKVDGTDITLEVQQQLGDGIVRTIALGSTDGLKRNLSPQHRRRHQGAGRQGHARPHHGRARQPDRRMARSARRTSGSSTARRRATQSRQRPTSCWKPASRSSTWCAPSPRAARSACSAAPASARPSNMMELINNIASTGLSVFAGVGERTREGNDFYHEMKDVQRARDEGGHGVRPDERAAGQTVCAWR